MNTQAARASRPAPVRAQAAAVFRREIYAYFLSPMTYLVWVVFLVGAGYLFAASLRDGAPASLDPTFLNLGALLLFVIPLLTMRLLAEEHRLGTLEVLLTDPVDEAVVVAGKYFASLALFLIFLLPTGVFPAVLARVGSPDPGPVLGGYVGLVFIGAFYLAVGLLASAATLHQVAAAALTFTVLLVLWLLGAFADGMVPGRARDAVEYLSTFTRFAPFRRGILDTRALAYCTSLTVLCLFVAARILALRRLR